MPRPLTRERVAPATRRRAGDDPRLNAALLYALAVILAGWLNRHQQRVLEYLREENRVLKVQLDRRKLRLADDDCVRLAVRGVALGACVLDHFATIVTAETILRWHRNLIAQKWTFPSRRRRRDPRQADDHVC